MVPQPETHYVKARRGVSPIRSSVMVRSTRGQGCRIGGDRRGPRVEHCEGPRQRLWHHLPRAGHPHAQGRTRAVEAVPAGRPTGARRSPHSRQA